MTGGAPFDCDFLVVGSGFGGSVSALRLAEKGYRVLVLEQGRRLAPEDFPRSNWNLRRWLWAPRLRAWDDRHATAGERALAARANAASGQRRLMEAA